MRTFRLNKLVRDNIPAMMEGLGQEVQCRVLDEGEYLGEVRRKLIEEATEFDPLSAEPLKELADLQSILDEAVVAIGATKESLLALQQSRDAERGAFANRYYVETVTTDDNDKWAAYYAAESERYPEMQD